jgi:hypothetical protein
MFDIPCKNCGHTEVAHAGINDPDEFQHNMSSGLWPDSECFDTTIPFYRNQFESIGDIPHQRGYRFRLATCPEYMIAEKYLTIAITEALRIDEKTPYIWDYLIPCFPQRNQKKIERRIEHARSTAHAPDHVDVWTGAIHTITCFDPRTGSSFVLIGE